MLWNVLIMHYFILQKIKNCGLKKSLVLEEKGMLEEALNCLEKVSTCDQLHAKHSIGKSRILIKQSQLHSALECVDQFLKKVPDCIEANQVKIQILSKLNISSHTILIV